MQYIYAVRHGQTDANVKKKINDKNVVTPLNELGIKQSIKTGKYFKKRGGKYIIYSSPSIRALQTAKLIAKELKITDIIQDNRINEIDHGLLSGLTQDDALYKTYMKDFEKMPKDPIDFALSIDEFDEKCAKKYKLESSYLAKKRVKSFMRSLPNPYVKKHIIIVTHCGIITTMIWALSNINARLKSDVTNGKNCTINCITREKNKYTMLTAPNTLHLG